MIHQFNLPEKTIYNAAGCHCTTLQDLEDLQFSQAGAIMTKSCTLVARDGNPKPKYWNNGEISVNSNGLENLGYLDYLQYFKENRDVDTDKPFILSVAGLSLEDNITIIQEAFNAGVYAVELNLSCPNLGGVPVSQDIEQLDYYLKSIVSSTNYENVDIPLGLKLPIYTNKNDITKVAEMVEKYDMAFITCSNSMPNCIVYDSYVSFDGEMSITNPLKNIMGGLGGKFMKPIVLGQIYQFRQALSLLNNTRCKIIMCGGISRGFDCLEGEKVGANYFQIGTALDINGTDIFEDIIYGVDDADGPFGPDIEEVQDDADVFDIETN